MATFKDLLHGKGNPYSKENVTRFTINDTLPQGTYVLNGGDALWFDDTFIGLGNGKVKFTTTRSYQVNNIYIIGESATLSRTKIEEDIVPFEFHIGDELPPIDTIHITQPYGENLSQGEGDVGLRFEDLELIRDNRETVLPIMYNLYQGFAYREYEGLHPEDWDIQPGDVVMVGDVEDNLHPVFVTKRELKYGSMKLFSEIPSQEEVNTNYVGTFENRTEIMVDKVNQEITAVVEDLDDEKERVSQLSIDLDQIRAEVTKVNLGNILMNANGELGSYQDWKDFASNDGIIVFDGIKVLDNMTSTTIFEILEDSNVLGGTKLSFFGNGKQKYELRPIVEGYEYSYRAKRVKGTQPRTVEINEYDGDQVYLGKRSFVFDGTDTYEDIPNLSFGNDVKFISITYIISGVSVSNRLEIAETMFAIGSPKLYYKSADNVSYWAQSEFKMLSDEIELKVNADGIISSINLSPETIKILASQIQLEGYTSINDHFIVLPNGDVQMVNADVSGKITATSGKIGGFDISGNNLVGTGVNLSPSQIGLGSTVIKSSGTSGFLDIQGNGLDITGAPGSYSLIRLEGKTLALTLDGENLWLQNIMAIHPGTTAPQSIIGSGSSRFDYIYLKNQPNVSSDTRHKFAIQDIPQDLIERLSEIKPKMYLQGTKWHFGYIAQDVERALFLWATKRYGKDAKHYVDKFAVLHKDESMLSLLYGELVVLKEQQMMSEINSLKERLDNFELHNRYK